MVFSSVTFLMYFLPIVMLCYFLVPKKGRNFILCLASLFFYAWGEPKNVILMLISIGIGYGFGIWIGKARKKGRGKAGLLIGSGILLSFLFYYKYIDFAITSVNRLTGLAIAPLKVVLPIGISFYTFQIVSYFIDVYRGSAKAQKNILDFAAYVMLFPQLIAGPIVRYVDIDEQLSNRKCTVESVYLGLRRFVMGLSKKVLLADQLGAFLEVFLRMEDKTVLFYWMYAVSFTLQIYFDFSGYSDMAIGLGKVFGFDFLENFNYPYVSLSITEFWRRWHMSLGFWFRDYVYIPLGGNRVGPFRWFCNLLIVWALTGLWHGASWNFVWWGLLFGVVLILEKKWLLHFLEKMPKGIRHFYVMTIVVFSFVLFQATDMAQVQELFRGMFGRLDVPWNSGETRYYMQSYAVVFGLGIVGCTPFPKRAVKMVQDKERFGKIAAVVEPVVLSLLFLLVLARLVDGSFQPFLYFRF